MGDTWIACSDISDARAQARSSILAGDNDIFQPYEPLRPFDVDNRSGEGKTPTRTTSTTPALIKYDDRPQKRGFVWQKTFWIQVLRDVQNSKFGWLGRQFFSHLLPLLSILLLLVLLILMSSLPGIFFTEEDGGCTPDGDFELSLDNLHYTPWTRSSFFAVNIKFGSYSFGIAKLIDVSWDVGVGRGGQAFLAWISYSVFTKAISYLMERSSLHHHTFKAVTLQNDTVAGMANLAKGLWSTKGSRGKATILWIILAGAFVLLTPTWVSAMTGYTAAVVLFVQDRDSLLVPATNFKPVVYTVHDGSRLGDGFIDETRIALSFDGDAMLSYQNIYSCSPYGVDDVDAASGRIIFRSSTTNECKWMWAVSKYVAEYGLLGKYYGLLGASNTTFQQPDDSSNTTTAIQLNPALNISAHFAASLAQMQQAGYSEDDWDRMPSGHSWVDRDTGSKVFDVANPLFWESQSQTIYDEADFNDASSCQQRGEVKYQWGFSFLLLYAYIVAALVWAIGMYALHLNSWLHSHPELLKRHMGIERAVLDMSQAMKEPLVDLDPDKVRLHANSKLQTLSRNVQLTYADLCPTDDATNWARVRQWRKTFSFKQWLKDEIWWLLAAVFFDIMVILSWCSYTMYWDSLVWVAWSPYYSFIPGFGVFLVLLVGREVRRRWLLALPFLISFLVLDAMWVDARFRNPG